MTAGPLCTALWASEQKGGTNPLVKSIFDFSALWAPCKKCRKNIEKLCKVQQEQLQEDEGVLKTFLRAGNSILVRRAHTFQEGDDDDDHLIGGLGDNDFSEKIISVTI